MKRLIIALFIAYLGGLYNLDAADFNINPMPDFSSLSISEIDPFLAQHEIMLQQNTVDLDLVEQVLKYAPTNLKRLLSMLKDIQTYEPVIPKTILLVGAPGLGKSTLTRGIAVKYGIPYTFIECPLLANEYRNSGPQNLHRHIGKAYNQQEPRMIILDEIGAIVDESNNKQENDKDTIAAFLSIVDKLQQENPHAIIIATTNSIEKFPDPVKSRFQECIELQLPTLKSRMEIIKFHLQKKNATCNPALLRIIAQKTQNFSGRDLAHIIKIITAYAMLRTSKGETIIIGRNDIIKAFKEVRRNKMFEHLTQSYIMQAYKYLKKNNSQIVPVLSLLTSNVGLMMQYKGLGLQEEGLDIQKKSHELQEWTAKVTGVKAFMFATGAAIATAKWLGIAPLCARAWTWIKANSTVVKFFAGG